MSSLSESLRPRRFRGAILAFAFALAVSVVAKPPVAVAGPSDTLSQRLRQVVTPYTIQKDDPSGWRFVSAPVLKQGDGGTFSVRIEKLAYVVSTAPALTIDFPAVDIAVVPEGDAYAATLTFTGDPQLRGAAGVLATASLGEYKISGRWDPVREAFSSLGARFSGARVALANGLSMTIERLSGTFTTAAGESPNRTAGLDGAISVEGLQSQTNDKKSTAAVDSVSLRLGMKGMDKTPGLQVEYTHALTSSQYHGLNSELLPHQLELTASVASFPWAALLRGAPSAIAAVADKAVETPSQAWSLVWTQASGLLGAAGSDVTLARAQGQSGGLKTSGKGQVRFQERQAPTGKLTLDVLGLNERIAALTPKHRETDPMVFPALALMTAVGKGVTKDGRRLHRFAIDMNEGNIVVNGRDTSSLKPKPP
ncbi:MAG: DUF2125 domain-containing protein [Alphaproteobacteria bacterium]